MEQLHGFFFVFFVGFLGYLLFSHLKIPNPALLGSIIATGVLNAAGFYPKFEIGKISFLARTMLGIMLGKQINRGFFIHMKSIVVYVLLVSVGMFVISLVAGYTIYHLSDVSFATALLAGAAGGIAEMGTFGMSIQADAGAIVFMHIVRLIFIIVLSPWIALLIEKAVPGKTARPRLQFTEELFFRKYDYVFLVGAALLGAYFFETLRVPNGPIIGATLACGLLAIYIRRTYRFDSKVRCAVQITIGLILGYNITPDVARELPQHLLPGLVASVVMLAGSVLFALILYKFSSLDIVTCVLSTSPAGLSQAVFLADEMGAEPLTTSIFQTSRLLSIVAFYPWIVMAIT